MNIYKYQEIIIKKQYSPDYTYQFNFRPKLKLGRENVYTLLDPKLSLKVEGKDSNRIRL